VEFGDDVPSFLWCFGVVDESHVFIVDDGKVAIRRIKTGGANGQGVIVAEGLSGGEQVIVEGIQSLRPGMPVKANPAAPNLNQG